jgi:hypothetical protein
VLKDTEWWLQQMELPLLKDSSVRMPPAVEGDGPIQHAPGPSRPTAVADYTGHTGQVVVEQPNPKKQRVEREKQHNVSNGQYTTNRRGTPICWGFNSGTCNVAHNQVCAKNPARVHICSKCLAVNHGAHQFQKAPQSPSAPKQGKGGGKGKGGKKPREQY